MPDLAYLNGAFLPISEARVSIEDRGFQFGDGVYEVIRTYAGRPFQLQAHLERLRISAASLQLTIPDSIARLTEVVEEGLRRAALPETKIYLQVTRGVAPRDHVFPKATPSTLVMTFRGFTPMAASTQAQGVAVLTMEDLRWARCDIKSVNLLGNVLARQRAVDAGVFEAILVRNGLVTEGSVSNAMAVERGTLCTAPTGPNILAGITRQVVLELARKHGVPVREEAMSLERFRAADEAFLTGTTVEVLPVVRIDNKPVGVGSPGPITRHLSDLFQRAVGR